MTQQDRFLSLWCTWTNILSLILQHTSTVMAFFFCGLLSLMVVMPSSVVTRSVWKAFSLPVGEAAATGGPSAATRDEMRFTYSCLASSWEETEEEREERRARYCFCEGNLVTPYLMFALLGFYSPERGSLTFSRCWLAGLNGTRSSDAETMLHEPLVMVLKMFYRDSSSKTI